MTGVTATKSEKGARPCGRDPLLLPFALLDFGVFPSLSPKIRIAGFRILGFDFVALRYYGVFDGFRSRFPEIRIAKQLTGSTCSKVSAEPGRPATVEFGRLT